MALEVELAYFNENRSEWVKEHQGSFVAIQGKSLLGFFDQWEEALRAAVQQFGYSRPFLVKEVLEKDRPIFVGAIA